ncbi:hypothetical protein WICPIJ_001920 [Wickerhamomyces pijperi]|uniref:Man(5)GlcNAc(2)-PP-dolichol translocation protein RFT1 n=1 Tax=Wickerhamomyces pijperi TaxID=599730 RepID=A0A9P8TQ46_WICPI|nr:hypothetical protein WICPIJ_001920 [Wickerhamomyces pijperi]
MASSISSSADKLLSKSTNGVTFLLFGSFFTKLATFFLNQILITFISAKIFGINNFLEFLMGIVLFFSREGIRLSSQRIHDIDELDNNTLADDLTGYGGVEKKNDDGEKNTKIFHGSKIYIMQSLINLAYIPLFIGIPLATVLMGWQYGKISDLYKNMELFNASLLAIWCAIVLELLSEPFYLINQFNLDYDKRTRFETAATTLSCFVNFGIVWYFKDEDMDGLPILAFSLGKMTHGFTLLVLYYLSFRDFKKNLYHGNKLSLKLTELHVSSSTVTHYFDQDTMNHFQRMFFNLGIKHLLTEGDRLVITSLYSLEEQGVYSLISNYGSLLARLVFAPVEESLRNFLTRLLSSNAKNESVKASTSNLDLSLTILQNIFKFYIYLSLLIIVFGPLNSGYLIQKIVGNNWSNQVSDSMPLYTLYLPLLAFNGILEAVHQSTATGHEVVEYTYYMVFFSVMFFVSTFIVTSKWSGLAIQGLIMLNMANMLLRIFYCAKFIEQFYSKNLIQFKLFRLQDPTLRKILAAGVVIWLLDLAVFGITRNVIELAGNVVLALALVGVMVYYEKDLILQIVRKKPLV